MWVGNKVYFLSDRNGPFSLYAYDVKSKKVETALAATNDIKSASAGPGAIVYEQFGSIGLFDLATGKAKTISVTVPADLPNVRPHYKKLNTRLPPPTSLPAARERCLKPMATF